MIDSYTVSSGAFTIDIYNSEGTTDTIVLYTVEAADIEAAIDEVLEQKLSNTLADTKARCCH
jgi:hypothetical protein